jgi:lysophospholipase L1-like esterase
MTPRKQLQDKQTLLFIGDSITDCGRSDHSKPLGNGYVRFVRDLLIIRQPEKHINIINRGISGNTVVDLRSRWHEDVLQHAPEWLSVKIGINDLNRHLGGQVPSFPDPAGFREIYDQLLSLTRKTLPETEILLIAPFLITRDMVPDSNRRKSLDLLEKYLAAVKDLAEKYKTRFLNLHPIFQERIKHHHPDVYCPEPVHPNWTGHLLIAEDVYRVLTLP